jgi:hypothetical protein
MIGDSHRAAAELIERAVLAQADLVVLEAAALDSGFTKPRGAGSSRSLTN